MISCRFLLLSLLVGTAMSVALASPAPAEICDKYCGAPPNLKCCDHIKICPQDNRSDYDCSRPEVVAFDHRPTGPAKCFSDIDCHAGALCCWDSCLAHRKCTNV